MNTKVEQKIVSPSAKAIYKASHQELQRLEQTMSFYKEESDVSLLNRYAGIKAITLSKETMAILQRAQDIASQSNGAFNPLLAPLIQLWKSAGIKNQLPTCDEIKSTLARCKPKNLVLDHNHGTAYLKQKGSMVDLGGIGKGLAADVCCDLYQKMGVTSAFVNLGGNVKTIGQHPDQKPWTVGLQHPDKPRGHCYGAILCSDLSVVTSGGYERYTEIDCIKYHHILDGRTGFPATSDLKSVTVLSESSMTADALSTAAFVMGLEKGVDFIYNSDALGGIFFTTSNEVYLTKGVRPYVKLLERLTCYEI